MSSSGGSNPLPIASISSNSLPIIAPVPPHTNICNGLFGSLMHTDHCLAAGSQLPIGEGLFPYFLNEGNGNYDIPWSRSYGSCRVKVSVVGVGLEQTILLRPNAIRGMAGYVIDKCVTRSGGVGGLITGQIDGAMHLTVASIASGLLNAMVAVTIDNPANDRELLPSETQSEPADILSSGDMIFDCDMDLGKPGLEDCSQIEYSQLGPPSDSLSIGPGRTRTLTQNSCNVKISASVPVVITWEQVQASIDALIHTCVANPVKAVMGGIAHFGKTSTTVSGKGRRKKAASAKPSTILPPGVNITINQTGR